MRFTLLISYFFLGASAAPFIVKGPSIKLSYGSFNGKSSDGIDSFLGIPFAQPPVENLRFRPPQPVKGFYDNFDATSSGVSCPYVDHLTRSWIGKISKAVREVLEALHLYDEEIVPYSEDCLTLDIVKPSNAENLPVMFWIFGSAFAWGNVGTYDGTSIVRQSINMGQPIVWVGINYRTNVFGFPGGKEIGEAGAANLGLLDQRLALQWGQQHISSFGGDPKKVTVYGESSGAVSISYHMYAYDGKLSGLFRAAIMQSGTAYPVGPPSTGQATYDFIVQQSGCTLAPDTLECLRRVPTDTLIKAVNMIPNIFSYTSIRLPFMPHTDGVFLTDNVNTLLKRGKYAKIPVINGCVDDEGTVLTLGTLNITSTAELKDWMMNVQFPTLTSDQADRILELYPSDVRQGSPYNTGFLDVITSQNKRISSLVGDYAFQALRRAWLLANPSTSWTYLGTFLKATPFLGSYHTGDLKYVFGRNPGKLADDMQQRWIAFANNLDPNYGSLPYWPKYDTLQNMLEFDGSGSAGIIVDNFRSEGIAYLSSLADTMSF